MSDATVAHPKRYAADVFNMEWIQSSEPEDLIGGLYATACLLDIAYRGYVSLEAEAGQAVEGTTAELVSDLVRFTALGAHSLAKHHGLLPSQREGAA